MLSTRERWYRLHHARRVMRRHDMAMARQLQTLRLTRPELDFVELMMRIVNPPVVVDPTLPRC